MFARIVANLSHPEHGWKVGYFLYLFVQTLVLFNFTFSTLTDDSLLGSSCELGFGWRSCLRRII